MAPHGFADRAPTSGLCPPALASLHFEPRKGSRASGEERMQGVKKGFAIEFINRIRTMEPGDLNALIVREAGEDLAQFLLSYSASLISRDPERVIENTSSLMLMGYLIRAAEERRERLTSRVALEA
jgi:hypothetical protein